MFENMKILGTGKVSSSALVVLLLLSQSIGYFFCELIHTTVFSLATSQTRLYNREP